MKKTLLAVALCLAATSAHAGVVFVKEMRTKVVSGAPPKVVEETQSRTTTWREGLRERSRQEGNAFVQVGTTLHDARTGETWVLDEAQKKAAPLMVEPQAGLVLLAADYGLEVDATGAIITTSSFRAMGDSETIAGAQAARYLLETGSKTLRVEVWVANNTALSNADWVGALRRRLGGKTDPGAERFLAAWAALPGYPVRVRTTATANNTTLVIDNLLVEARSERIAPALLRIPKDYAREADGTSLLVSQYLAREREKDQAFLREHGLSTPFVPSAAKPLPPPLAGGSCTQKDYCFEQFGRDITPLKELCSAGYSDQPCSRTRLLGICAERTDQQVFYRYEPLDSGRWKEPHTFIQDECPGRFIENPAGVVEAKARARAFVASGGKWHCKQPYHCVDLFATTATDAKAACFLGDLAQGPCPRDEWVGACWERQGLRRVKTEGYCTGASFERSGPASTGSGPAADVPF
ncbi:hypothetical protein OV203_46910 [Nannocystis sp. ILAH1]|uniref:hypothetical protein n=1 Tax=Nannocystis sp. ILAH1 TaxID=2996789 RepID=UPI00226DBFA3|nr:hypothetical protein [Nannocystis sp. ILAH1]MCY0994747.1 hypothetical protein [Nannocystis sp. ILAH1]